MPTDIVLANLGYYPNTDLLKRTLRITDVGGFYSDIFLRAGGFNIFIGGDVCTFPYWYNGELVNIQS